VGPLHAAEKWVKRNFDPVGKIRYHSFRIERDGSRSRVGVIIWQEPAARREGVQRIRYCQLDFLDPYFQDIAGLRALDVDRAGQNVYAWPLVFDFLENIAQWLFNLVGLHTCAGEALGT
jgi:hypothetical protein